MSTNEKTEGILPFVCRGVLRGVAGLNNTGQAYRSWPVAKYLQVQDRSLAIGPQSPGWKYTSRHTSQERSMDGHIWAGSVSYRVIGASNLG